LLSAIRRTTITASCVVNVWSAIITTLFSTDPYLPRNLAGKPSPVGLAPSFASPYNTPPFEATMPFSIRPFHRFPVQWPVTHNGCPFRGQGRVWNLSYTGWRLSGDLPMRAGETLSLKVTLPNERCIEIIQAVRWSRGQEFAVETVMIGRNTHARLQHYMKRLIQAAAESLR
jgi:hypothetical protein